VSSAEAGEFKKNKKNQDSDYREVLVDTSYFLSCSLLLYYFIDSYLMMNTDFHLTEESFVVENNFSLVI